MIKTNLSRNSIHQNFEPDSFLKEKGKEKQRAEKRVVFSISLIDFSRLRANLHACTHTCGISVYLLKGGGGVHTESIEYMEGERERLNDRASIGRGVASNILRYTGRLSIHYQLSAFVARRYLDDIRRLLQTGSSRGDSRASFSINLWSHRNVIDDCKRKSNDLCIIGLHSPLLFTISWVYFHIWKENFS